MSNMQLLAFREKEAKFHIFSSVFIGFDMRAMIFLSQKMQMTINVMYS